MALNIWSADIHHLFEQFTEVVDGPIQEACPLFELSYCLNGEIYCE